MKLYVMKYPPYFDLVKGDIWFIGRIRESRLGDEFGYDDGYLGKDGKFHGSKIDGMRVPMHEPQLQFNSYRYATQVLKKAFPKARPIKSIYDDRKKVYEC